MNNNNFTQNPLVGHNIFIGLQVDRVRSFRKLKDVDNQITIGYDYLPEEFSVGHRNMIFLFNMCMYYEGFLESIILTELYKKNPNLPCYLQEEHTIKISSLKKYIEEYEKYTGTTLIINESVQTIFDLRNYFIHGSLAFDDKKYDRYTLKHNKNLKSLNEWINKEYNFKSNLDYYTFAVFECNAIFNRLFFNLLKDMISKANDDCFNQKYNLFSIKILLDVWSQYWLQKTGGDGFI